MAHSDEGVRLEIVGDQVALGPLRPELFPLHLEWVNESDVAWSVFGERRTRTIEEEVAWLDRERARPENRFFLIYRRDDVGWRPVGVTSLTDIDARRGTATFRIMIGAAADRGRGVGTEATRLVLRHAFVDLGLHNVALTLMGWNDGAKRVYERAGFREVGRRREAAVRDGKRWDIVSMDCLASEFAAG